MLDTYGEERVAILNDEENEDMPSDHYPQTRTIDKSTLAAGAAGIMLGVILMASVLASLSQFASDPVAIHNPQHILKPNTPITKPLVTKPETTCTTSDNPITPDWGEVIKDDWLKIGQQTFLNHGHVVPGSLRRIQNVGAKLFEGKPIHIGILGGSFARGVSTSFKNALIEIAKQHGLTPKIKLTDLAQGGADFLFPWLCMDVLRGGEKDVIDLWVVDYLENGLQCLRASSENEICDMAEKYESFLGQVLFQEKFKWPAMIVTLVSKRTSLDSEEFANADKLARGIGERLGVPVVSFMEIVRSWLSLNPKNRHDASSCSACGELIGPNDVSSNAIVTVSCPSTQEGYLGCKLREQPELAKKLKVPVPPAPSTSSRDEDCDNEHCGVWQLFNPSPRDPHFSSYGFKVIGAAMANVVVKAVNACPIERFFKETWLESATPEVVRLYHASRGGTCNCTLTHGKEIAFRPTETHEFELWVQDAPSDGRTDVKAAFRPTGDGAWMTVDIDLQPTTKALCVFVWGVFEQDAVIVEWNGRRAEYHAGWRWCKKCAVYTTRCDHQFFENLDPRPRQATLKISVLKGAPQVAGVALI